MYSSLLYGLAPHLLHANGIRKWGGGAVVDQCKAGGVSRPFGPRNTVQNNSAIAGHSAFVFSKPHKKTIRLLGHTEGSKSSKHLRQGLHGLLSSLLHPAPHASALLAQGLVRPKGPLLSQTLRLALKKEMVSGETQRKLGGKSTRNRNSTVYSNYCS